MTKILRARTVLCLWLVLCLPAFNGTAAAEEPNPKLDLWPFFYYAKGKDGAWRVEVFWPFFEASEDSKWKKTILRPVWNLREEKGKNYRDSEFLWPLGRTTERSMMTHSRFFPLYFCTVEKKSDGTTEKDFTFLPFIFKRDTKYSKRDGFWPFYGKFTNALTGEELVFVMWPIYTRRRKADVETVNILWPFLSFTKCEGGGGWKF